MNKIIFKDNYTKNSWEVDKEKLQEYTKRGGRIDDFKHLYDLAKFFKGEETEEEKEDVVDIFGFKKGEKPDLPFFYQFIWEEEIPGEGISQLVPKKIISKENLEKINFTLEVIYKEAEYPWDAEQKCILNAPEENLPEEYLLYKIIFESDYTFEFRPYSKEEEEINMVNFLNNHIKEIKEKYKYKCIECEN